MPVELWGVILYDNSTLASLVLRLPVVTFFNPCLSTCTVRWLRTEYKELQSTLSAHQLAPETFFPEVGWHNPDATWPKA